MMRRISYASFHLSLIAALGLVALTLAVNAGEPSTPITIDEAAPATLAD